MHSENNYNSLNDDKPQSSMDEQLDDTLDWLLEQSHNEPEEKLFALADDTEGALGLSEAELEMASRPMFSSGAGSDDLAGFVEEEIVMSSVGDSSDIYKPDAETAAELDQPATRQGSGVVINAAADALSEQNDPSIAENADILSLSDDDDIGDKPLVLQRVKPRLEVESEPELELEPQVQMDPQSVSDQTAGEVEAPLATEADSVEVPEPQALVETSTAELEVEQTETVELSLAEQANQLQDNDADAQATEDSLSLVEMAGEMVAPVAIQTDGSEQADTEPDAAETVLDYVSSNDLPADDEGFDDFLLAGEHLDEIDAEMPELSVQHTEGIAAVDPDLSVDIDYHEDFAVTGNSSTQTVVAVTEYIAEIMEELTNRASDKLATLEIDATALNLQFMLACSEEEVADCQHRGYRPLTDISADLPAAAANLGQTDLDAIYVRIDNGTERDDWNLLFKDEFATVGGADYQTHTDSGDDFDQGVAENGAIDDDQDIRGVDSDDANSTAEVDPVASAADSAIVYEESLLENELLDMGDEPAAEATFDPLALNEGDSDELASPDALLDLNPGTEGELEDFDLLADDLSGDSADHEAALEDVWSELEPPSVTGADEEDEQTTAIFDDDVFDDSLMDELGTTEVDQTSDVDELLKSFGGQGTDIDEVCGITVDAFEVENTASNEEKAVTNEHDTTTATEVPAVVEEAAQWFMPAGINFDYTSQSTSEVFKDFLDAFLEEGALELEKLEDAVSEWEKDIDSKDAFTPIPRILHTLKGIAKGVGLQRYGTLIHNFETLLEKMPRVTADDSGAYFRIVNTWLDAAVRGFETIEDSREDVLAEIPQPANAPAVEIAAVTATRAEDAAVDEDKTEEKSKVSALPELKVRDSKQDEKSIADEGAKTLAAQQTIRMTPEAVDHLMNLTSQAQQLGVRSSQGTVKGKLATAELQGRLSSIRSHIAKIADRSLLNVTAHAGQSIDQMDALEMDQYSELQEAANILREGVEDLGDLIQMCSRQNVIVEALLKQQASVISSLRSSIQDARVIPVSRLMPGVRRIVRTVGAELGKAVSFRVLNEVGSLDRDNFNRCQIILEHMVRNALDHGIEAPDERVVAGKPMTGRISVDVSKQGSEYVITLADDGRGIDPDMMRETAFDKALDLDVAALSDEEAQRLIFHKGFSTASELSEISGRGVGMDIVFSELQQIGGDIEIASEVGQGTTFRIRIPSNVTVNGALLVNAGGASYAVPLDGLIAVEHVATEDFFAAIQSEQNLELFGMSCEPSYLGTLCGGSVLPLQENWGDTVPVIIAGGDDRHLAIAIDDLEQALELVIRSLGNQFTMVPGLAGGATTADGQAVVALDLNALVHSLEAANSAHAFPGAEGSQEQMTVLVVDDSRTQRMVATSQFDTLGVETFTAENGLVAIDWLNSAAKLPDVVLLDIEMPVKDGIQTLREIRKSPKFQHLPVIMVTSRTGAKHRKLAEDAGCNGYMGKPFNFPLLVQDINRLTGRQLQLS